MTEALALLFYLAVLALVVGCFVYLWNHRGEGGREVTIVETCPLGELGTIFRYEPAFTGWESAVMSLEFTPGEDGPEIIVWPEDVALFAFNLDPFAADRFRRSAAREDLYPSEGDDGQCSVAIAGTRAEIARKISRILQEVYQVDDAKTVDVKAVFRRSAKRTWQVRLTGSLRG